MHFSQKDFLKAKWQAKNPSLLIKFKDHDLISILLALVFSVSFGCV